MTIDEQKKYLAERLELEPLCISEQNKKDIESFEQATCGDNIAVYLRKQAWDDDIAGNTKVYLVKDKVTKEIVYFFAINCGIIYNDLEEVMLFENEKEPFNRFIEAIRGCKKAEKKGGKAAEKADLEYVAAMQALNAAVNDPDRASNLFSRAEDKALAKEEARALFSKTEEQEHTKDVKETFPAIDIKFLCRNKNYKTNITLDFRVGVYVFWEIIVPLLLNISNQVGCKYIYLFAADNSDAMPKKENKVDYLSPEYDLYSDDECEEDDVLRLVDYYKRELHFSYVTKYKVLKPKYERRCFTLIQEVDKLQNTRDEVWFTLIPMDNTSEG